MKNKTKKTSSMSLLFRRLFGINTNEQEDIFFEEQMQSPLRTIIKNFVGNKLAMVGLIVFLAIFAFVIVGPIFFPIQLSYQESTQGNIGMGSNMLSVPSKASTMVSISTGSSFSVGADVDGNVFTWGYTKINKTTNMKNIPEDMGTVVAVAAGYDHALALNDEGELFSWGSNRLKQAEIPNEVYKHGNIVQIAAGYQLSVVVTDKDYVIYWGNENLNDIRVKKKSQQGEIQKVAVTSSTVIGLTVDGEVIHLGAESSDVAVIPQELSSGVVDIVASGASCAAILEDGSVVVWGTTLKGEGKVPEFDGSVVSIAGGRYHYTAVTENGTVYSWGSNMLGQTSVPSGLTNVVEVFAGYYQNYAIKSDGSVVTWGLKGYLLGTDDLGRDILGRLVNGGRMTMMIGAVSVLISTIIGIIVGGISGFFGGKVDIVLSRLTEVIAAMPFLPFAMILSSIIGNSLAENMRIILIMIVLGVLSWPQLARLVRAQVLAEREKEFVIAARAIGVKEITIVFKHIIPNVISVIIVNATLSFATSMLTEATLSYLGFGVSLPRPTWGNMLYGCNDSVVIQNYWWRWVFPAVLLSICVICINVIGDGLRDAIDPKSNER